MEILQKLMAIPKNIIKALKNMKQQTNKVQNNIVETFIICNESRVVTNEVKQIDQLVKKRKLTINQEKIDSITQTDQLQNIDQVPKDESQKISKLLQVGSKQNKKQSKLLKKQSIEEDSISRKSDQTELSQKSYCQNHFLKILEQYREQSKLQQNKIYQSQTKCQNQFRKKILKNYLKQFTNKQDDENKILKSAKTLSPDEKQFKIDQKESENIQQKQELA
ncbi:unnamed protein product (macronuclear) [Paramecium tetraurelia]|uniref:Uncharacterized protein n=1 Tax=Paramecium tetraurelia TaxID=5888 RepID=A0CVE0_PARTE|nr:uncharacterized protein GSPATT00010925001 [Paramecium tetraurelia]CAK74757.1 unnamed protein product [Paramecium tetraurelia]|eukprot:XP_001442154.1 hypothetical protein (macronuclear) [Paramecium tetraurelia strain d4-2]